jgi:hypothetical protein
MRHSTSGLSNFYSTKKRSRSATNTTTMVLLPLFLVRVEFLQTRYDVVVTLGENRNNTKLIRQQTAGHSFLAMEGRALVVLSLAYSYVINVQNSVRSRVSVSARMYRR